MLRGINVGGRHLIKMEALRTIYASLGFRNPRTYIQSGNVLFETDGPVESSRIEDEIERLYRFRPLVIQRTAAELRNTIDHNPFAGRSDVLPARLLVVFFAQEPRFHSTREEVEIRGREMYIHFIHGMGKSKLRIPAQGTARNWNTVTTLLELADGHSAPAADTES